MRKKAHRYNVVWYEPTERNADTLSGLIPWEDADKQGEDWMCARRDQVVSCAIGYIDTNYQAKAEYKLHYLE